MQAELLLFWTACFFFAMALVATFKMNHSVPSSSELNLDVHMCTIK